MSYGSGTYRKNYSSTYRRSRFGARNYIARPYAKKATRRTRYTNRMKSSEKKYMDKALISNDVDEQVTGVNANDLGNGFMYASRGWSNYDFSTPGTAISTTNDLVKSLTQGTTATTRIGNKIKVNYIKGAITLSAAKLVGPSTGASNGDMNGEALATPHTATNVWQYLRTTFRVVIVKDLQVNSADAKIDWNDVFETSSGAVGETGGVHAELKIASMGRFVLLSDRLIKTDAVSPQETIRFMVPGSEVGNVRYNGPSGAALTDKGIYVIWSAYVTGVVNTTQTASSGMIKPGVTMHSRLAFTD